MATIISNIESFFKEKSILSNLIAINILVFFLIKIIGVFFFLFNSNPQWVMSQLELPALFNELLLKPWTIITYMFTHTSFWHLFFNLLWLYWFGKMFLQFFSPKQLGGLYFLGGISGGLLFVLSYNFLPYFQILPAHHYLMGASASVMAIVFGVSFYRKDLEVNLLLIGRIKIIYIALFCLILDLISIQLENPGGHIAHIGGALIGFSFAYFYNKGKDLTKVVNSIIDSIVNLFTKKPENVKMHSRRPENDMEYNARKNKENEEIDLILEKIKRSGYANLTEKEKKKLFDASKK